MASGVKKLRYSNRAIATRGPLALIFLDFKFGDSLRRAPLPLANAAERASSAIPGDSEVGCY